MEIEDEDVVKPEGWSDDEPEEIDHPRAKKSKYWNDELFGKWEAPKIDNPKCEEDPGCGEWKRPRKRNPAYKCKWHAPLIDNPNYKGIWKPRDIPNPRFFYLENPNFERTVAVGIEMWTMQDGIIFDNILIADDEKVAASYRETTWKPMYDVEKKKKVDEVAPGSGALAGLQDLIEKAEIDANLIIIFLASLVFAPVFSIAFRLLFRGYAALYIE